MVIARDGVMGTSHRKVAAEARVPLGSMTYYFNGMRDLLHCAFEDFAARTGARLEKSLARVTGTEEVTNEIVNVIMNAIGNTQDELVLTQELYTLAARDPNFRDITDDWMARSRTALERHFDSALARDVDALIEGLSIHGALAKKRPDRSSVKASLYRLVGYPSQSPSTST
ncbi:DNA-binding transcriptional regulator YbjK [Leifsonia sp. EB41]|uniref:TetR/AcrR family transcriptional regulator n=1 Tax=Leifsonia sp. EB41 TaxID=3156260 RepID=UPI0035145E1E